MKNIVVILLSFCYCILSAQPGNNNQCFDEIARQENRIINMLDQVGDLTDSSWEALIELLKNNPYTLKYDFKRLLEKSTIEITQSDDGQVRCYYSFGTYGGQMGVSIIQYQFNDAIYVKDFNAITSFSKIGPYRYLSWIMHWRGWLSNKGYSLYVIDFKHEISVIDEISINFDGKDWLNRDQYGNSIPSFIIDSLVHVPREILKSDSRPEEDCNSTLSGQYDSYIIKDGKFCFVSHEGDPFIHESLKRYYSLTAQFKTKHYIIRVDEQGNGLYRYSSWKHSSIIMDKPRIIVYDGVFDENANKYVFINGNYTYNVGVIPQEQGYPPKYYIEVYKNKQLLLREANN